MNFTQVEATVYDNISEAHGRQEVLNTLRAQAKRIEKLEKALASLQYYVSNPSAWDTFDDEISFRIRKACEVAEPKFWMKKR